ncbi:winged helix-turn-helix domain-containing protein [Streptomyces sp. NBC_00158]|uniref:winged helix-turn-helix domain-containing protein n=1 Tax=Streptomyces sp. NBC_00158 TaxID=2903627 RepID=UPI00386372E5
MEVHISALRRKIDRPFRRLSIVTVRGTGYKFVAGDEWDTARQAGKGVLRGT